MSRPYSKPRFPFYASQIISGASGLGDEYDITNSICKDDPFESLCLEGEGSTTLSELRIADGLAWLDSPSGWPEEWDTCSARVCCIQGSAPSRAKHCEYESDPEFQARVMHAGIPSHMSSSTIECLRQRQLHAEEYSQRVISQDAVQVSQVLDWCVWALICSGCLLEH